MDFVLFLINRCKLIMKGVRICKQALMNGDTRNLCGCS